MKPIRIAFLDFPGETNPDAIKKLLENNINFVIDSQSPQFIFFSVFGNRHLEHTHSVKIFFTGENVHADFNLCDYAFGFDWMTFEDRYIRCPNFLLYKEFELVRQRKVMSDAEVRTVLNRPRFCNFIYSNATAHPYRENLFQRLNSVKAIDSAGMLHNSTGTFRGSPSLGEAATFDKIEFQRECRFSFAVEYSSSPGYTTEKLIHALAADSIPIYWGDPKVGRQFNTKRFINCHDFGSVEEVVLRIIEIENNPDLATAILKEPVFPSKRIPEELTEAWLVSKLCGILKQQPDIAKRRNRYVWGQKYEAERILEARFRQKISKWRSLQERVMNKFKRLTCLNS